MHSFSTHQLTLTDLAFEHHDNVLFGKICCTLMQGDLLEVRGSNGTGKSTLLRMLAGFIPLEYGSITWNHQPIHQLPAYREQLHYIGHQQAIKLHLTVNENLQLYAALLFGQPCQSSQIDSVLEQLKLKGVTHQLAMTLSAGQQRRLALARLLIKPAPLWILDEPFAALDAQGQTLLTDLIKQHLANQGITILTTHQQLPLRYTQRIHLGGQHAA